MPLPLDQSSKELLARQNGFPSYDAMILFQANKERQVNPTANVQQQVPVSPKAQQVGSSWGIAPLFEYLTNALNGRR